MKNKKLMIPLFAFLASLTACESNDLPIQHADSYRYITFAARTQKMTTRADDRYESYDPVQRMHPKTWVSSAITTLPLIALKPLVQRQEAKPRHLRQYPGRLQYIDQDLEHKGRKAMGCLPKQQLRLLRIYAAFY